MKGVICPLTFEDFDELKLPSLFVDKLVPANVRRMAKGFGVWPGRPIIAIDIEYLSGLGILETMDPDAIDPEDEKFLEFFFSNTSKLDTPNMISNAIKDKRPLPRDAAYWRAQVQDQCFHISELLNFITPGSAVSLAPLPSLAATQSVTSQDVMSVVLHEITVPHSAVSWEDIIALKSDDEFQYRLRLMNKWIETTVGTAQGIDSVADDIKTQLYEYNTYMAASGIKCQTTSVDFVVTTVPGIFEDIIKLRLESLFSRMMTFRKNQALLQLEELKAPGRTLSIVPAVNRHLSTK